MSNTDTEASHECQSQECQPATVYDGSVCVDLLITNTDVPTGQGLIMNPVFENLTVKGRFLCAIHPNLHKSQAYQCTPDDKMESSSTDLVISRNGTSVRFGELDHMTSKGRVVISRGTPPYFDKDIGDGLGLHCDIKDNASVIVYTNNEDPSIISHGVIVLASNFIPAQEGEYTPVLSVDRSDYTKIKLDDQRSIRNIHVKGSMFVDHYIHLHRNKDSSPEGWFFGQHSGLWFQPPKEMVIPEKQAQLEIAEPDDMVISRGPASVLLHANGRGVAAIGPVAVLLLPVHQSKADAEHNIKTVVVFQ